MIFTVNVSDWQRSVLDKSHSISPHVWNHTLELLELLEANHITCTFFVERSVAEKYPLIVQKMVEKEHEVAAYIDTPYSQERFNKEAMLTVKTLEDITGAKVIGFRNSGIKVADKIFDHFCDTLRRLDVKYDSSLHASRSIAHYTAQNPSLQAFSTFQIQEYPLPGLTLFGKTFKTFGSPLFRLMPYFVTHSLGARSSRYNTVFQMHSYDIGRKEFAELKDRHQIPLALRIDFLGREKTPEKLDNLLRDFPFVSFRDAYFITDAAAPLYDSPML